MRNSRKLPSGCSYELVECGSTRTNGAASLGLLPGDLLVVELTAGRRMSNELRATARRGGAALVLACAQDSMCSTDALARADEWLLLPATRR